MKFKLQYCIQLFVIVLFVNSLHAQKTFKKFYHITRNSGLSQSTINTIVKDRTGFIWFGTDDGLNRYNGYTVQHFKHDENDYTTIGLGRVHCIYISKSGQMWVGTDQGGLDLYDENTERFCSFKSGIEHVVAAATNDIRGILETADNRLWLGCYEGSISLFDPKDKSFRSVPLSNKNNVTAICYDNDSNLYIGTTSGVEIIRNAKNGYYANIKSEPFGLLKNINIISIYRASDGTMWFGTYGKGAFAYTPSNKKMLQYTTSSPGPYRIGHNIVRAFTEDKNKNVIIGTGGSGLNILDENKHVCQSIKNQLNNQFSLGSDVIYCFLMDEMHNLWIGTYNAGVDVVFEVKDKFGHIRSFGEENSLSANSVLTMLEDKSGNIWIGTDGGGMDKYNPRENKFEHFRNNPNNPNSLSGTVVKSLMFDKDSILWIGTFNEGLNAYNPKTRKFTRYYHDPANPNSPASNHVWDIDQDEDGMIWIATLNQGLDCFDPKTRKFTHFLHNPKDSSSLSDYGVSVIEFDKNGNLWVGTEFGGISVMKKGEWGKFQNFVRSDNNNSALTSNQICSIFEDSKGRIWVGTLGGGINVYDEDVEKFYKLTVKDGLASNLVYAFLEDKEGNIWISTNNGLSKLKYSENNIQYPFFQNYDLNDGLLSNEFSPQSAMMARSGLLYFGGINGINYFMPESLKINTNVPPVVLTDFRIFNKSVAVDEPGSPLKVSIIKSKIIEIDYSQSVITFEFAALDYVMPSKNRYQYKLEGFEQNWNDVGNQRTATYTNLNPGKYVFRVKGSNNDNVWNEDGASVLLVIRPPFYKTWTFWVILITGFVVLTYFVVKERLTKFEKQQRSLKIMVDTRTKELVELNEMLEIQNQEIDYQRAEVLAQKENLEMVNKALEEKQNQIQQQNIELEKHRNHLEELVAQRTAELEVAKQKAEESDRLKMAFLSNMSHEIRTPMNAIIGFSSLLNAPDITEKEKEDFIRLINANSEALLVLIDDILDLSRIEANQIEIKKEVFNVSTFIHDLILSYRKIKKPKESVDFYLNLNISGEKLIETDRHRLRQVLLNLIDNAFKFTPAGSIELKVEESNGEYIFAVKDTGIGIDEASQAIIFDRFVKGHDDNKKVFRGAGLGLAISKSLMELLGGSLEVQSKLGEGSTFYVKLSSQLSVQKPFTADQKEMQTISVINPVFTDKVILLAEDEKGNYLYLSKLLGQQGAIVHWAKNGIEAVDMCRKNKYDLVLMDIKMPDMDGIEAFKIIRAEKPELPVIAQTAFARHEEEQNIRAVGFDDYISKPIRKEILLDMIKRVLSKKQE